MKLAYAFLADSATIPPDGKAYVLGGGFNAMVFPRLPAQITFAVVAGFLFGSADVDHQRVVELRLVDADGKPMLPPVTLQFQSTGTPEPGIDVAIPTVGLLSLIFAVPGSYTIEFWTEGRLLSSIGLRVNEQVAPKLGPRPN